MPVSLSLFDFLPILHRSFSTLFDLFILILDTVSASSNQKSNQARPLLPQR